MTLSGPPEDFEGIADVEEAGRVRRQRIQKLATALVAVFVLQGVYMKKVIVPEKLPAIEGVEAILVYGGVPSRIQTGIMLAERLGPKWVVYSGTAGEKIPARGKTKRWELVPVTGAYTTDQNARLAAPALKKLGAKSVLLVTSWYHMPRALMVTHLYLLGSGIRVMHLAAEAPPRMWWKERRFLGEIPRFWGTIMRVGLAAVGVEGWPRPAGFPGGNPGTFSGR